MGSPFRFNCRPRLLVMCGLLLGWTSFSTASEIQGFTEPYQDIDVATAEMGIIEAFHVKEGDRVEQDQLLVSMDAAILEVTLEIANSIKQSRGQLESAIEELNLQTTMIGKLEKLRLHQHASIQELDRARAQKRIAEARVKAVREELAVKTLEHERIRVQLERSQLRSPIDGIVTRVFRDRGESVLANDPIILKVVQLDPLLVIFLVPADLAQNLKVNETVSVQIGESHQSAKGEVEFVSPTIDPQSGLTRVRVRLPNPEERLPCGATCYLHLAGQRRPRLAFTDH